MTRWIVCAVLAVTVGLFLTNRKSAHLSGFPSRLSQQNKAGLKKEVGRNQTGSQKRHNKTQTLAGSLWGTDQEDTAIRASLWQPRMQALNRAVDSDVIEFINKFKEDIAILDEIIRTRSLSDIALEQAEKARSLWDKVKTIYGVDAVGVKEKSSSLPSIENPLCSSSDEDALTGFNDEASRLAVSDDKASVARLDACRKEAIQGVLALDEQLRGLGDKIGEQRLRDRGVTADRMQRHQELVDRIERVREKGYKTSLPGNHDDQTERLRKQREKIDAMREQQEKWKAAQEKNRDRLQQTEHLNTINSRQQEKLQAMRERMQRMQERN